MNNVTKIVTLNKCTGCGACELDCPTNCISVRPDTEGFLTPFVDAAKCVHCGKCVKVCHTVARPDRSTLGSIQCVLFASENEKFFNDGTSGGAFGAIAQIALSQGYKVCGAAYSDHYLVKHVLISEEEEIESLQGSKYVQSDTRQLFKKIDAGLKKDEHILFSGTPCQVAALRSYLGREDHNLLTLDIVCHGVPSPAFWNKNISVQVGDCEAKVSFRNKVKFDRYGYVLVIKVGTSERVIPWQDDVYYKLFMDSLSLRECCYRCVYASAERAADITLGDCARMDDYRKFDNTEVGTAVYVNTHRGAAFVDDMFKRGLGVQLNLKEEVTHNKQLSAPAKRPEARDRVYQDLDSMPFIQFQAKYLGKTGFLSRVRREVKKHVSWKVKLKIRRFIGKFASRRD